MASESEAAPNHVLLVSFPGQGHINPLLRLGKRLASKGLFVTFTTPENAGKDLQNANRAITDKAIPIGDGFLRFDFFDDGWDEADPRRKNLNEYLVQLEHVGKQVISKMIHKDRGKVVQWSPQEEVLAHPSVSCFVIQCGWNSSMEALTCGVPLLTFPAWGDQITNAKFLVDVFGVGVRLGSGQDQNKWITRDKVNKCLEEATVGPRAHELKNNSLRWKAAAEAAIADGGSSSRNLEAFVEDVKRMASLVSVSTNYEDQS